MAIIRNTASMMLKGKVGATTYYVAESRQLARQAMNNSNYGENASRTDLQQARRVKWSNLVNFYSANKAWMKKAYEELKPGVSIFNRFMQLNINAARVALTRGEAQAKVWVPSVYRVTQGSLTPLRGSFENELPGFEVEGPLTINETTTVAQFSQSFLAQNPNFRNGDAIVFVFFSGTSGDPGDEAEIIPATYRYLELVLDNEDTTLFQTKYISFNFTEGRLTSDEGDGAQAAVVIHTRKSGGKLYVSTQDIFLNEVQTGNLEAWRSASQLAKAIASYGESSTIPLAPGGEGSLGSGNDSSSGGGSAPGGDGGGSLG